MDEATIRDWRFSRLCGRYPQTAARYIPLVITQDTRENLLIDDRWHRHLDFFALYIVHRGRGRHTIERASYGIARGDVYLMNPGTAHAYSDYEDLVLEALYFQPALFGNLEREALREAGGLSSLTALATMDEQSGAPSGRLLHLTPDAYEEVASSLSEIRTEWSSPSASGAVIARGLCIRLLITLTRYQARSRRTETVATPSPGHDDAIAAAVRKIDADFATPLRIQDLAATACLSVDRFTKLFTSVLGRTPRDYLTYTRLEYAKLLLTTTDLAIYAISTRCGFDEAAYFTRKFHSVIGMSPSEYRKQYTRRGQR
jgi:AraC-like DNA-binding protein/mannose-6-phosphate isomerase-like protein (cupin superfamily)